MEQLKLEVKAEYSDDYDNNYVKTEPENLIFGEENEFLEQKDSEAEDEQNTN